MTPDLATSGGDAVNLVILSAWFSGIPFAYITYLLNRKLRWKGEDPRLVVLSLALGVPLAYLLMHFLGNAGVWPAAFALIGCYVGLRYAARVNAKRDRRRMEQQGPDRTQRLLFEQMTGGGKSETGAKEEKQNR
jgi:membrane associated rhomboid family serine protease